MSKITFRADDELITQLEEFDASKSEVMREALREYLDTSELSPESEASPTADARPLDELVTERVDELAADRLEDDFRSRRPQEINLHVTVDGDSSTVSSDQTSAVDEPDNTSYADSGEASHGAGDRMTDHADGDDAEAHGPTNCAQCGEVLSSSHVYCPNCGEKSSRRVFCECGDELRSDWAFCPGCGRRTAAADVLDQG